MNKTKNKIANAFLILLDSKGDDQITNNEIIENAGISKGTFYNNFDSQQAIAHFIFHEIDSKIIHAIIEQRTTLMVSNSADLLLKCVADATIPAIYNQREKIRILYKSSINGEWKHYLEGKYLKTINRFTEVLNLNQQSLPLILKFGLDIIELWITSPLPTPPEEFIDQFCHLFKIPLISIL
ncbi:TetR/AcrR family transcriptional regulator [Lactobacillus sp. Sy-1]|uniref:TetR/AcrR family transcriptional regulator n=1 Tax=Lactobacillus sp. Sy-1 TaxID=2109645 RepID=UPI001C5741BF|nr:TetR/AcrR family transcriptional regulator [Lactobacillus sp. Sy-1]MBW1605174.1 TetR/AcrR family transcriptional regulator [Lactobacillus sp. Sy-1]